jgi:hypothetical protein
MLLCQDIDECHLGWGYLKIGPNSVVGPPGVHVQPWFPKEYSLSAVDQFWEQTLGCGYYVDNTSIEHAVDIAVPPGLIKRASLVLDAQSKNDFKMVEYHCQSKEPLILVDGFSRLHAAQLLLLDLQQKFGEQEIDYMIWLARFYDKGSLLFRVALRCTHSRLDSINSHSRAHEMKYIMVYKV